MFTHIIRYCKPVAKGIVVGWAVATAFIAFGSARNIVSAASCNFGGAISGASVELRSANAPGRTGNGPVTILANGTILVPAAFQGGLCASSTN
jgi:hypothetical protein